jgi:hypothetical protein
LYRISQKEIIRLILFHSMVDKCPMWKFKGAGHKSILGGPGVKKHPEIKYWNSTALQPPCKLHVHVGEHHSEITMSLNFHDCTNTCTCMDIVHVHVCISQALPAQKCSTSWQAPRPSCCSRSL